MRVSLDQGTTWTTLRSGPTVAIAIAQMQGPYSLDPDFADLPDKGTNSYDPDTIYISTGNDIYLTKNGGLTWVNRTGDISGGNIVDIFVDPRNRDVIYAIRSVLGTDTVWYSTDAGQNWTEIGTANGLPNIPIWKIVVDPRNDNIYLGTDIGVFVLKGGPTSGNRWERFGIGMPNVQVRDLELNLTTNTLLAGTYGRSVYQMFLDTPQTAATPLNASVVGLSGQTVWAGPVIINGDPSTNTVTVGAYGIPNLPNPRTNASLNFNGTISDLTPGTNPTLRKIGNGDVILSGANIYGGVTDVQQGVLVVDNDQALGRNFNGTIVRNGSALHLRSNLGPEPITLYGQGQSFDGHYTGSLRNIAGDNTYTGTLTLATDATIGVDSGSSLTIGSSAYLPGIGSINGGTFTLNKELLGTLVLAGSNSLGGPVNVYQGALRLGDSNALSAGNTVTVLNGAQIQLADTNGSPVSIAASLNVSGTGIFGTGAIRNISGNNTWSGPITLQTLSAFAPVDAPPGVVSVAVDRPQDTLTLSGVVSQTLSPTAVPMGLEKIGPGRLTLSGANTYSGATEIYAGTVRAANNSALGTRTTTTTVQRLVIVSEARQGEIVLSFNGQQATVPWNANNAPSPASIQATINSLIVASGLTGSVTVTRQEINTYTQNGPRGLVGGNAGYSYAYTITFGGALATTNLPLTAFGRNGATALATFVARGGVNVRVWDGATLELDGSSGNLTIANKHLTLYGSGVGGNGALRNIAGNNNWNGPVYLATDSTVDVASGTVLTFSGGVQSGSGTLYKTGTGTLQFPSGTPANNQASTVINGGTVEVLGTLGPVQINGGTLQGTGTVGTLTVTSTGGAVRPGDRISGGTIGTLTVGPATFNNQTTLYVDLVTPSNHDLLSGTGNIDLGNATLTGTADPGINLGDAFTIIQTTGTITGQFAGPSTTPTLAGASGATIVYIAGAKFVANYFTNQVILTRELPVATINLTTSVTSPVYGQPFTVIATLTPEPLAPLPTGSVVFTYTDPDGN
ncbi:MAG: autotransporter-associated beta strand repeat-containing protein, partial [Gemmataceae bacterium]|nr:autotransporter-associated beta strand repeat-containing protein [Gemmataceae bacterium]